MNKFASPDDPEVGKIVDEICEKAHQAGVPVGAFVSDIEVWRKRNLNWAALSTDYGAIFRTSTQMINQFNGR
jgi:2-keto-3-deoxy-L-rhamnonate aldolase RhmA